jgi:hypothetical protein
MEQLMDILKPDDNETISPKDEVKAFLAESESGDVGHPRRDQLLDCCKKTIDMHAANNPMMVCPDCKQIIKCFDEERPFRNYQRFCASRHRKILATQLGDRFVVVFKSYDMYSS